MNDLSLKHLTVFFYFYVCIPPTLAINSRSFDKDVRKSDGAGRGSCEIAHEIGCDGIERVAGVVGNGLFHTRLFLRDLSE